MPFDPISYSLAKKGLTWEKVKQLMKTEGALNLKYDSDLDGYIDRIGPHTHDIADIIFNGDFDPTTDNTYEIGKLYKRLKDIHSVHLSLDGDEITNPELYFYNDYLGNGWKIRYEFNEETMYTEYFLRFNMKIGPGDIPIMHLYFKAAEVEEQSLRLECHILPVHDDSLYIGDSSHRFKEIHAVTGHINNLNVKDNLISDIIPNMDDTYSIGSSSYRLKRLYAVNVFTGDLCFEEKECAICGEPFKEGDELVLRVVGVGDYTRTVPVHLKCSKSYEELSERIRKIEEGYK